MGANVYCTGTAWPEEQQSTISRVQIIVVWSPNLYTIQRGEPLNSVGSDLNGIDLCCEMVEISSGSRARSSIQHLWLNMGPNSSSFRMTPASATPSLKTRMFLEHLLLVANELSSTIHNQMNIGAFIKLDGCGMAQLCQLLDVFAVIRYSLGVQSHQIGSLLLRKEMQLPTCLLHLSLHLDHPIT